MRRAARMGTGTIGLWVALLAMPAGAAPLDADACTRLKQEQAGLVAGGAKGDMARGPDWAKANLSGDKLKQIERYIDVEEQILFRCPQPKPPLERAEKTEPAAEKGAAPAKAAKAAVPPAKEKAAEPAASAAKPKAAAAAAKAAPEKAPPEKAAAPAKAPAAKPAPKEAAKPKTNDAYVPPAKDPAALGWGQTTRPEAKKSPE